ncbi:MAG: hypothetical protein ABJB16_14725 [Saprospiraceae bacterium]
MKSNFLFCAIGIILFLSSCKSVVSPVETKSSCVLEGKYLNYTVLEHCPDILPGQVPNFALEIDFKHKDTINLYNGFERFRMAYTGPTDSCTYTIKDATQFGDMKFRLQGDTIIQLFDSAWTQLKTTTIFRRIDDSKPWGFANYLNECVLVGTWNLIKEGAGKDHKVIFLRNGQVDGMKPYLAYEICYAGDCLEETEPFSNTISLLDDRNQYTTFSFVITPGRRTIKFYSIGAPVKDQKGGRKIGALAFELQQ